MRYFDYLDRDYSMFDINCYIEELITTLKYLKDIEKKEIYDRSLKLVESFKKKYPDLNEIDSIIFKDLINKENATFLCDHGYYKEDASRVGLEFEEDLHKIFEMEEELNKIAGEYFSKSMTSFEEIKNGEEFITVGHSSFNIPGTPNSINYNDRGPKYLSCSLFSNMELNAFNHSNIVYLVDINQQNFILASYFDISIREDDYPSIFAIKKENKKYLIAGYGEDTKKFTITIATPRVVEKMSVERETKENGSLYKYDNGLTNEVVLDREKTNFRNALLIGCETDLMIIEYFYLKAQNIPFKCINKGLYMEKEGLDRFDEGKLNILKEELKSINMYDKEVLEDYYKDVVLEMNYSERVLSIINESFSQYINIENVKNARIREI